jgi:hypothetical protein
MPFAQQSSFIKNKIQSVVKKLAAIFLLTVLLAGAMIPINQVSAQPNKKAPKQISLYDVGILQLVAHDFYNVDRVSEIDAEDEKLNLSTVLDHGDENIANGGEPRNMENILVFTVATKFGQMYLDLIDKGQSQEQARKIVLGKYISDVKQAYQNTFDEKFPKPAAEEDDDNLTGDLALRTLHDMLPGKIRVNGVQTPILDPSLLGKTLGKQDLRQLSSPLDGQFDSEFSSVPVPDPDNPGSFITIDLLERDRSFAEQFETDFSFDDFLAELTDGHYDKNDTVMQIIRDEFSAGQVFDSEDNPHGNLPFHHNPDKLFKFKK